ncbi:hypothetical protein AVEN_89812-1 [Araneus ventricosus]|uniref:Uncharacterized protein n=1 Tax=Araneus ventricosus TaxID=182803 RepID=A0A4Y2QRX0_ARAVE|nr:hypothetical protein AVEN_89812-1 [Araneus ventricosus]
MVGKKHLQRFYGNAGEIEAIGDKLGRSFLRLWRQNVGSRDYVAECLLKSVESLAPLKHLDHFDYVETFNCNFVNTDISLHLFVTLCIPLKAETCVNNPHSEKKGQTFKDCDEQPILDFVSITRSTVYITITSIKVLAREEADFRAPPLTQCRNIIRWCSTALNVEQIRPSSRKHPRTAIDEVFDNFPSVKRRRINPAPTNLGV